jgi:ABC-2 type transport system ATP-binding protein
MKTLVAAALAALALTAQTLGAEETKSPVGRKVADFNLEDYRGTKHSLAILGRGRKLVGYLPENLRVPRHLTGFTALEYYGNLSNVPTREIRRRRGALLEKVGLAERAKDPVRTYSKGMLQRLGLAQAMLHDPELFILDEPTDGLDPNQKHEARQLIRRMDEKKVIMFSTHILEEVEAVCTRAIIIDRGKIVANGTPAELKQRSDVAGAVSLRVIGVAADTVKTRLSSVTGARKAAIVKEDGNSVWARAYPAEGSVNGTLARGVAEVCVKENWKFEELHTEEGRLDEVFRSITWSETGKKEDKP